ncbi:melanoma-associated antigen 10-like [Camelus bactrianus]|uniref:Melanoma-associated antigen 10-like n=2 Tax=Camelus TaxID=9836 RepID=A0AC58PYJ6_CAMBA
MGREDLGQQFLKCGSQRDWGLGMTGGASGGLRGESQVLPGVKVTPREEGSRHREGLGLRHVFSGHRAQEAGSARTEGEVWALSVYPGAPGTEGTPRGQRPLHTPRVAPRTSGCAGCTLRSRLTSPVRFTDDRPPGGEPLSSCSSSSSSSSTSTSSSFSSTSSSSSPSSASSSSPSSFLSSHFVIPSTIKEVSGAVGTPSLLQGSQRVCSSHIAMAVTPSIKSDQGSSSQDGKGPSTLQSLPVTGSLFKDAIEDKVADLVGFLLLKYHTKELITKVEMLIVIKDYQDHFPVILSQASECLQLVFGIDVKELDPISHSYVLVNTLGLTYNGMLSDDQSVPKTGLLINILSVIFMDGNCSPEQNIWEVLSVMGLCAGRKHFIYGEPRELITKVWVQEGYLEYRQVANSDPARHEFLWGPRAHAETSKMKILELLAKINGTIPNAFPILYEDALRDEEKRSQARVAARASSRVRASGRVRATGRARARVTPNSFCRHK